MDELRYDAGAWRRLRVAGREVDAAEAERIATDNRMNPTGKDPHTIKALRDVEFVEVAEAKQRTEALARKHLVAVYNEVVPVEIRRWQEDTPGIGEWLLARLLGYTGHPCIATPFHWEVNVNGVKVNGKVPKRLLVPGLAFLRTPAQHRQYVGYGDPERRRREGISEEEALAMGNPQAKKTVRLIVERAVWNNGKPKVYNKGTDDEYTVVGRRSPYCDIFEAERARREDAVHSGPCHGGWFKARFVKCKVGEGEDRRYAEAGDPMQPSHKQAIAYRHTAKRFLDDLFDIASGTLDG